MSCSHTPDKIAQQLVNEHPEVFEEFQKTQTAVDDVYEDAPSDVRTPGFMYCDGLRIARLDKEKCYSLIIGNQEWLSDDIRPLEVELFNFACSEGWVTHLPGVDEALAGVLYEKACDHEF